MLRRIVKIPIGTKSCNFLSRNKSTTKESQFKRGDIAFETDYYYKQDKQLLTVLKQRTQEEIRKMQDEVEILRKKMDEQKRNIEETVRFLKSLENDVSSSDTK